jgi:hypothetical protein
MPRLMHGSSRLCRDFTCAGVLLEVLQTTSSAYPEASEDIHTTLNAKLPRINEIRRDSKSGLRISFLRMRTDCFSRGLRGEARKFF